MSDLLIDSGIMLVMVVYLNSRKFYITVFCSRRITAEIDANQNSTPVIGSVFCVMFSHISDEYDLSQQYLSRTVN